MSQTRYCSTCGALLGEGAAICGECGARYQASPYERRATDAPGAWSQPPTPRSRDLGPLGEPSPAEDGVELISRESLAPQQPGATALRTAEQYDQQMVTQPPMPQNVSGPAAGTSSGSASPASAPGGSPGQTVLPAPLDGCVPASPLKRLLAAVIDSVIASLVLVPLLVGGILAFTTRGDAPLLPFILIGVGVALPVAYTALMIWLTGAKGFSIGKLILGLRITRSGEAGPVGVLRGLGRWFVYAVFPLLMALSIFLDPEKHLRGFHDRAIGSVVVDIHAGRNPMQPRPDDFERESAEHYLGAPSVAVSAHENLLAEPGAAWQEPAASAEAASQASAEPAVASGAWGAAASPYAPPDADPLPPPPAPAAEAPASSSWDAAPAPSQNGGWAPPPTDPVPPQSGPAAPQTDAAPLPGVQIPQQTWGDPPAPAPQPWPSSAAAPNGPASEATQGWAPPEPADPVPYGGMPSSPAAPAGAPSDITGDAWGGEVPDADHGVDEQTRLTVPEGPLGDLEATRLSPAALPPVRKLRLVTDDGAERIVEKAVVVGRNPAAPGDEVLFVMKDDTRSVSKTHLLVDGTGEEVTVTDLGSTNGSSILRGDSSRESLVPNTPTVLPEGAQITLGDRTITVERMQ